MRSVEERVTRIESDILNLQHDQADTNGSLSHLTAAIGDLSQGQRALALDVREIQTRLTGVETRLTGVETRLTGVETRLTGIEGLLTQILSRLPT